MSAVSSARDKRHDDEDNAAAVCKSIDQNVSLSTHGNNEFPNEPFRTKVNYLLNCMPFKLSMSFVVLLSIILLIIETDARANGDSDTSYGFLNATFLAVYFIELVLHLFVERSRFIRSPTNIVDIIVVISGVIDLTLQAFDVPNLQMLRIVHSMKLLRAAKLVEIFPELYALVHGMWSCIVAMSWGLVFVSIILVLCSIFVVEFVSLSDIVVGNADHDKYCNDAFSSVGDCLLFFFRAVVLGDGWGLCIMPLVMQNRMWSLFFTGVSLLINLGVLNLILAVIVDEANNATEKDKHRKARAIKEEKKQAAQQLEDIFHRIDRNDDKRVSLEELLLALKDDKETQTIMTVLGIDDFTTKELFKAMDKDGDNHVNGDEFRRFLSKSLLPDMKTHLMAMRIIVDRVQQDQGRILEHLEAEKRAPLPPTLAAHPEKPELVAGRRQALPEGHRQTEVAHPPPGGSVGAPGAEEEGPLRGTGDGIARAAPLTTEGAPGEEGSSGSTTGSSTARPSTATRTRSTTRNRSTTAAISTTGTRSSTSGTRGPTGGSAPPTPEGVLGPRSESSHPSWGRQHAGLAEPASAATAAAAPAEGGTDAQRRGALDLRESAAPPRDERAGDANGHRAASDPLVPRTVLQSTRLLSACPPAAQLPQMPLCVQSAGLGFAPSRRGAPSETSAAARAESFPVSGAAPPSATRKYDEERMLALHRFISDAGPGVSHLHFDRLALYLDSLGVHLSTSDKQGLAEYLDTLKRRPHVPGRAASAGDL